MISTAQARELIDNVVEDEALVIGGLVAVRGLEDDIVWRLIRSLDVIRGKALRSLDEKESVGTAIPRAEGPEMKPHPAIEDFLLKLRRG